MSVTRKPKCHPMRGTLRSAVLLLVVVVLVDRWQQSVTGVLAGTLLKRTVDESDLASLGLSRSNPDEEGGARVTRPADDNKKPISERGANFPTVKKDLEGAFLDDDDDDDSLETGANQITTTTTTSTSTTHKPADKSSDDTQSSHLGDDELVNPLGQLQAAQPSELEADAESIRGEQVDTDGGGDKNDNEQQNSGKDKKGGVSRSELDLTEMDGPDVESPTVVLTIRGQRKKNGTTRKPLSEGSNTTLAPSIVMTSNGTNFLSMNGTMVPTTNADALATIERVGDGDLSDLKEVLYGNLSFNSQMDAISMAESIKSQLSSSGSVSVTTGEIDSLTGKLRLRSTTTTTTGKPKTTTTVRETTQKMPVSSSTTKKAKVTTTSRPEPKSTTTTTTRTSAPTRATTSTTTKQPQSTTRTSAPISATTTTTKQPQSTTSITKLAGHTWTTTKKQKASTTKGSRAITTRRPKGSTTKKSGGKKGKPTSRIRTDMEPTILPDAHSTTTTSAKPTTSTTKRSGDSKCHPESAPKCQCNYQEMKDSDKLLAVVVTNKGGFKGRRINSKAIETIMKNKLDGQQLDDVRSGKPIQVNTNNTYVLPAGHYYFPHPVRVAGLVSP